MKIRLYFILLIILIFIGCNQNKDKYNNISNDSLSIHENINLITLEDEKGVCFYKNGYIYILYFGREAYGVKFKTDDFKDMREIINKSKNDSLTNK